MREGWRHRKIADLVEPLTNIDPRKDPKVSFTYIDVSSVSRNTYKVTETSLIKGADAPSRARRQVRSGDVLFATIRPTLRRIAQIPKSLDGAVCSTGYFVLRPKPEISSRFLFYSLFTSEFSDAMAALQRGASYPAVSDSDVKNQEIHVPTLGEQERIVAILDEAFAGIDTAIANTKKNLANARELFESYLNKVFEDSGEGVVERELGDGSLINIIDGDRGKNYPKKADFLESGHCLFLNTKNVRPDGFRFDSVMFISKEKDNALRKGKLKRRDVVMTTRGTIGNLAVYDQNVQFENIRINSGMLILRPNEKEILSEYLFEIMRSSRVKSQIKMYVSGAAQPQLPIKTLVNFSIPVPIDIVKQSEVVATLRDLQLETQRLESIYQQKLTALTELKQSLLQKAFSGELTSVNVIPITTAKKSSVAPTTDSPAFAAHIMAVAYHWHESGGKNKTFGHVKAQKTLHLVEALAQIDLGRTPIKDAAGPNDFAHMRTAEKWAREHDYYDFVQRSEGQRGYDFVKGSRYSEWLARGLDTVEPYKSALDRVVSLLMPLDTQKAELVATVYAAWNNLLLDGHKPTEAAIVQEARDNWHPDKQQYTRPQFHEAIDRLRSHGMVPTGTSKRVTGQQSLEL